jgi:hypothetical protein
LKHRFNPRLVLRLFYNGLTLPLARIQLNRMVEPASTLTSLPHLTHEQAARPTQQDPP